MEKPPYCFNLTITHFSFEKPVINLNMINQLPLKIVSNGIKHSLVLIKPWPPLHRPSQILNDISKLSADDIESVCAFKNSTNTRIEITKKNKDIVSIPCKDIEGLPNRIDSNIQTQ